MIGAMCDANALQHGLHPLVALRGRHLLIKERQHHVFSNRQFVDQVETLENEADIVFANAGQLPFGVAGNIFATKRIAAGVR